MASPCAISFGRRSPYVKTVLNSISTTFLRPVWHAPASARWALPSRSSRADAVFHGRVTRMRWIDTPHPEGFDAEVTFQVFERWKGPEVPTFTLYSVGVQTLCDFPLVDDIAYIGLLDIDADQAWIAVFDISSPAGPVLVGESGPIDYHADAWMGMPLALSGSTHHAAASTSVTSRARGLSL